MGLSSAAASLACDAGLAGVTEVQLHTAHPGAAGTSNVFGDATKKTIAFAAASAGVKSTTAAATWASLTAAGTITHCSLWNGAAYRGNGTLLSPRTVAISDSFTLSLITMTVVPS